MNVKKLKSILKNLPDEMEVILAKDSEGNDYSPLADYHDNSVYIPHSTWNGEVLDLSWTAADACMSEEEWDKIKAKPKALILCPTN